MCCNTSLIVRHLFVCRRFGRIRQFYFSHPVFQDTSVCLNQILGDRSCLYSLFILLSSCRLCELISPFLLWCRFYPSAWVLCVILDFALSPGSFLTIVCPLFASLVCFYLLWLLQSVLWPFAVFATYFMVFSLFIYIYSCSSHFWCFGFYSYLGTSLCWYMSDLLIFICVFLLILCWALFCQSWPSHH